jgi:tRNA A-37 threonylcarbamoyl transferase component Bud32
MNTSRMIANRFGIGGLIGQGAMGEVYRGLDSQTRELVAIKALKQTAASSDSATVERFMREGEALRRLNHPNIVKVLASAIEGDRHYIVMEYVGGGSLDKLLKRQQQLPLARALDIAMDLADALVRAHRVKIIHRDIKPQNVLLAEDGTPRLTDFGVAHMSDLSTITQSGALVGTMPYLSPEAWQYEEPDEGTDIWAFGVMLYEMLAGRRPFDGDQPARLKQAIVRQPLPDLRMFRPDVPPALAELIGRMLEKDRLQRIGSMRVIGAELEAIARRAEQWPLEILLGQAAGAPIVPTAIPLRARAAEALPNLATLREIMKDKRRRLGVRQRQATKLGDTVDPSLAIEIEDLESEIRDLGAQISELEGSAAGGDVSTDSHQFDALFKQRRIDAALPNHASVGQRMDLIVQVRFPNSSALGIDDWPTRHKPVAVEQGSEPVHLKFEIDRATGAVKSTYLELQVVAPDFTVENATRQRLEVPSREYSKRVSFLLTPLHVGNCRVNLEVYGLDSTYLGTIAIETTIDSEARSETATLATHVGMLTLTMAVGAQPNLDLSIDTTDAGYTVQLHSALTNTVSRPQSLVLPPEIAELAHRRDVADWVKQARIRRLRANEELRQARAFGTTLFDQLFTGQVLEGLRASRTALPLGERLRLRLRLPPDLALIPWELLFDQQHEQFLALAPDLTVLRSAEALAPVAPLHLDGPLQVVAVLASPAGADYPPIQLDRELRRIETVLKGPHAQSRVALDVIRGPGTLDQLRARLRTPLHVLHVLCHGDLDESRGGVLVFEDADGAPELVGAELLRNLLRRRQPRLVLLNACLGALPGGEDPLSSVGAGLLAGGVPAVIAMQFELAEDAAVELARVFYAELAAGTPVDIALAEARLHLFGCYPTRLDWAIPVLFLRTDTGTLFAVPPPLARETATPVPIAAPLPVEPPSPAATVVEPRTLQRLWHLALTAYVTRDWERAAELLEQVADLKPDHEDVRARLAEARR